MENTANGFSIFEEMDSTPKQAGFAGRMDVLEGVPLRGSFKGVPIREPEGYCKGGSMRGTLTGMMWIAIQGPSARILKV